MVPTEVAAQSYVFSTVEIQGNERVDPGTILSYAGIARGQSLTGGQLNAAYQRVLASGLFESVEMVPQGSTLVIKVAEFPTINRINFEGNRRLKDEDLATVIRSQSRRVFNPSTVEQDAAAITEAYAAEGRLSARVQPRAIRRNNNRVDLVFEIFEGDLVEIERLGFVGNQAFSDARLRRVLETKQAGLLRALVRKDTFQEDRIAFDRQVLRDFYLSRGYVDFRVLSVNSELARERDGYFVTFNVEEGQQFQFGAITATSDLPEIDPEEYLAQSRATSGRVYTPTEVERDITRLERYATRQGKDFIRVEPRITRNDRDLRLDIEYVITRGQRVFVERIDIEGNTTTLDRVVRRQFETAEGDPFNPRAIREAAERIRALGYFSSAEVQAREGSSPDQVIVDVDVEEANTGSLSFGGTYSSSAGFGALIEYRENNFLGRGQGLNLKVSTGSDFREYGLQFTEPAFLGRDLRFGLNLSYRETDNQFSDYDTTLGNFAPSLTFPVSEDGELQLRAAVATSDINNLGTVGAIITSEAARGELWDYSVGYQYSYDTRRSGLDPSRGVLLQFGQDFGGIGDGDAYIKTSARVTGQTSIANDEVTLRASLRGGLLAYSGGSGGRVTDRYVLNPNLMRGFEVGGIGPRERAGGGVDDALGGNAFVVASFEAEFPLGLPEEYGIRGGVFYDMGSVWGLNQSNADVIYEDFSLRHSAGVTIYWATPVGPLEFNFSRPIVKKKYDREQNFNLTISTEF
ncbi:outer membrane protein assembly factor BamA [Mesobacterium pallidum]|uniref:outer membrane protein assembly factor BamA n=1 Tax=Mesobacterium pallidum TaxID=2872037 RepID=UPI001EE2C46D|nr:outer membrane protein assembly factor BamA [Mesobacterium pallidum]